MKTLQRKMSCSATNHGFTIPAKFSDETQIHHVRKKAQWAWVYTIRNPSQPSQASHENEILLLIPVRQATGHNIVTVQEMRLKREGQPDRIQKKLNIPVEFIRKYRLNTAQCKIRWIVIREEYLYGEIPLSGDNIRVTTAE